MGGYKRESEEGMSQAERLAGGLKPDLRRGTLTPDPSSKGKGARESG